MRKIKGLVLSAISALFIINVAFAGETDMLINKLAEKGVITYGEAAQITNETKEAARADLASAKVSSLPLWIQNITMSGDMRLRMQDDWNQANNFTRVRERVRLRTNFDTRLSEGFKAGFGFATGSEAIDATTDELGNATVGKGNVIDANSGSANSTFSGFGRLPLQLNLAFVEYNAPSFLGINTAVTAGKMRQGTQVWNATDLLWEPSMNPDGMAVKFTRSINDTMSLALIGSYLTINNINSAVSNPTGATAELMYTWDTEDYRVKLGVAQQNLDVVNKNCGTYYGTPGCDYFVMSESFDLTYKNVIGSNNIALVGDIAKNNNSAVTSDTNASCYGVKLGVDSVAGFGQWQIVYLNRRLEANSWLNKLGANDPYGAANNASGSQEQLNLGLSKAATLAFTYYNYDKINGANSTTPQSIFQSDIIYKF